MWLLAENVLKALLEAQAAKLFPTAEEQRQHAQSQRQAGGSFGGGGTQDIMVAGVLTKEPDLFAALFGGGNTSYRDIQAALAAAETDPSVQAVRMVVDSPGGHVDGLFDTLAAIESFSKPISVLASNAQSAAYAIAAAAGPIEASNPAATFGSIGVVQSMVVDESIVTLTNTESPDKRPDPTTEAGRAVIVKNLDAIHGLLVEAIASHRDTAAATVSESFGRGATLLASEAKKRNMIDSIARPILRAVPETNATALTRGAEGKVMNVEELKAQHPALYQAVVASGIEQGIAQERERCIGHLLVGEKAGALPIAVKAIREGTDMGFGIQAEYMAAMASRSDTTARERDEEDAEKALAAAQKSKSKDLGSQVADGVERLLGKQRAQGGHANG